MLRKNIDLVHQAVLAIVDDPGTAFTASTFAQDGAFILFDSQDADLSAANDALASSLEERGDSIVKVEVVARPTLERRQARA